MSRSLTVASSAIRARFMARVYEEPGESAEAPANGSNRSRWLRRYRLYVQSL